MKACSRQSAPANGTWSQRACEGNLNGLSFHVGAGTDGMAKNLAMRSTGRKGNDQVCELILKSTIATIKKRVPAG